MTSETADIRKIKAQYFSDEITYFCYARKTSYKEK